MSQIARSAVYTGPWVNWSHGRIPGSTITLSDANGALFTAFLAIFVTAAGSASWKIVGYTLHQVHAREELQDTLHHQLQVVCRNTGSAAAAAWQALQLFWSWRKYAEKPLMRILPLLVLALLHTAFFTLAAIFSSQVTKTAGGEVLIQSPGCGLLNDTLDPFTQRGSDTFGDLERNDTLSASTYSLACYGTQRNARQCHQYAQPRISWKVNMNASCPFPSSMCYWGANGAYSMDTGLVDSHKVIGINARKPNRIHYRKVTTCSPIHFTNYSHKHDDTEPDDRLYDIELGSVTDVSEYTLQYNIRTPSDNVGYVLTPYIAFGGSSLNGWVPRPELNRSDADVTLILFAANSVVYETPVIDPFFAATDERSIAVDETTNPTYYTPNSLVSGIACLDQHQFCNPRNQKCTQLTSSTAFGVDHAEFLRLGLNRAQNATAKHISAFIIRLSMYSSIGGRGASALRASDTVRDNIQVGLPSSQWMTEVSTWFGISMAKLQQKIVQYAVGPPYIPAGYNVIKPQTQDEKSLCDNQIIQTPGGTTSFSVLGIAIILIIGTLIIVTSLVLDTVVQLVRSKIGKKEYKSLQYIVDSTWQLQRLAYEEAGQGDWRGGASSVPVTIGNALIGLPPNVSGIHPRLSQAMPVAISNHSPPISETLTQNPKTG